MRYATIVLFCSIAALLNGCLSETDTSAEPQATASSCMSCHNGSLHNDYAGTGLENPHPFPGAGTIECSVCHGGDPDAEGMLASHVPPPPEIGDEQNQIDDAEAYFNRLTLTGIDKYDDYEVDGVTYSPIDFLQFVNPGDLRVVTLGRSCGSCHAAHAECVNKSVLATEAGVFSGAMYAIGVDNQVPAQQNLYEDTAADLAFRAILDPTFVHDPNVIGPVGELLEFPVYSQRDTGEIFNNPAFDSDDLPLDQLADGRVVSGSNLAKLYHEQIAFTCGDCHLGSAGANNRYGDYRSSGCTSCHMAYSQSGRSTSNDPNIVKNEPFDPDDIEAPERAHVERHLIRSVARTLTTGEVVQGMDDYTCAGCHQGSNRTVMQYWGIRLDQNQDVRRNNQYPANPVSFKTTRFDERLFDPEIENNTFNGRNHNQYLLFEDYDGDLRDDTPPDVHYEAGLGCIDCHGSHDLHGGTVGEPDNYVLSRQEQAVGIRCESCHGSVDAYADTTTALTYQGNVATVAIDAAGNPLKHVVQENGEFFLYSRLTGARHYVSQVRDVVVNSGKVHPFKGTSIYTEKGSYAMGRADGSAATGIGPVQTGAPITANFSHMDDMSCVACHSSWTNNCIGCHLVGEYNGGNNFSNITGERIVFREDEAQFVYQTPVPFQLGIDTHGKIAPITPNTEVFFQYEDINNDLSKIFSFSDRNANGANPAVGNPSLSHNVMMPHSIRGRVSDKNEGPRYCTSCHLTTEGLTNFGAEYDTFRTAMATDNFTALDFDLLKEHIGQNPNNQINSPIWVHMVAGLGSGLFMFDEHGCAVNPLDENEDRYGCDGVAPADTYDPARVRLNLDRIVNEFGESTGSNNHAMLNPGALPNLRDGAVNANLSGPLGQTLIERLTDPTPGTGIILDSWIDANGVLGGDAALHIPF